MDSLRTNPIACILYWTPANHDLLAPMDKIKARELFIWPIKQSNPNGRLNRYAID